MPSVRACFHAPQSRIQYTLRRLLSSFYGYKIVGLTEANGVTFIFNGLLFLVLKIRGSMNIKNELMCLAETPILMFFEDYWKEEGEKLQKCGNVDRN